MKVNKYKLWFGIVIALFILSERCIPLFGWMDKLHIKHILLIFSIFIGILLMRNKEAKFEFTEELKIILQTSFLLYAVSFLYQIFNGSLKLHSIGELYYLIAPIIFTFLLFNVGINKNVDIFMDIVLYAGLFSFFITKIVEGSLTFNNFVGLFNFKSLFINSISTIGESDMSVYFLILTVYYIFKNNRFKAFLAGFGTFICYKRIAVLFLLIFILINRFLPKYKNVNKKIFCIIVAIFILAPFAVYYMCNDFFAIWFYNKFGIDFNQFTMTRFEIINTVIDADLTNYGLGTVTEFLEIRNIPGQTNMHNDILRIYMECGIIGTIFFTINYFKICKNNYYTFFIMLFIFTELFVAHFLGPGSLSFWIVAYIAIFGIIRDVQFNLKE